MDTTEFMSRRALIGAGSFGVAGALGAAALYSSKALAQTPPTAPGFIYKSIIDYGASPNASGDQTSAIQDALNDLKSNDCLVFPPGIYNVTTGVLNISQALKNVQILGYGAVLQVTDAASGTNHDVLSLGLGLTNQYLQDLRIDGLKISSFYTTSGSGIVLSNSIRVALRDVSVWNMGIYCLTATNSWWFSTQNCVFSAAGSACVNHDTAMNAVLHSHSSFTSYAFSSSSGNPVNPNSAGVIHNGGTAVHFLNCDFSSCQVAVNLKNSSNVTLQACYFENIGTGVLLGDSSNNYFAYNTTVDNCYFNLTQNSSPVIMVDVSRAQSAHIRNNSVLTKQPNLTNQSITTKTINYDSYASNKNVIIDANRCVDGTNGGREMDFASAIVYSDISSTNKVQKYSLETA